MAAGVGRGVGGIGRLCRLLREYGGAVRRDLLVAGLRLDDLGTECLTWVDLRDFVAFAPPDSALRRVADPDGWITNEVLLTREVLHRLDVLAWMRTKDGERGINFPKRLPLHKDELEKLREEVEGPRPDRLDLDDLKKRIPMTRGGA